MLKVSPDSPRSREEGLELMDDSLCALFQIWTMKKNEDAAAKKKPKISAAQIRVQKGEPIPSFPTTFRSFRTLTLIESNRANTITFDHRFD